MKRIDVSARAATLPHPDRLVDDSNVNPLALGCFLCPDREMCGGLRIAAGSHSCHDRCCGGAVGCDVVCPRKPENFLRRFREVDSFRLDSIPRTTALALPPLPLVTPLLYGGGSRSRLAGNSVAMPMSIIMGRGRASPCFNSFDALAEAFGFSSDATLILSGTDKDPPLERWWSLERRGRRAAARALVSLGIQAATSLNFSMFNDRPRYDDLHSRKRIGIVWQEMVDEGLPTALHVNARTESDWREWIDFVGNRPEVTALAYEFKTPRFPMTHAAWLCKLAVEIGRPLRLVVRGAKRVLPSLVDSFSAVHVLDTTTYVKTIQRQCATLLPNGKLYWRAIRTEPDQLLDALFEHNRRHVEADLLAAASVAGPHFAI